MKLRILTLSALLLAGVARGEGAEPLAPDAVTGDDIEEIPLQMDEIKAEPEKSVLPETSVAPTGVVGPGAGVGTIESETAPLGVTDAEAAAVEKPAPDPSPLAGLFSVEENPGTGSLTFIRGDATRVVQFGKSYGHYGIGLVFDTKNLPQPYKSEFGRNIVVQIVLGKIPSARESQVSQFGSLALLNQFVPRSRVVFPIQSAPKRAEKRKLYETSAILMFTDPENPALQSDEDKLRNAFFGVAGKITVTPKGNPQPVQLSAEGESMSFQSQVFEIQFDSAVGTPFNPIDSTLQGKIEIPIYWPQSRNALVLIDSISKEILTGPDIRYALPEPPRKLSSQPKVLKPRRK